MTQSELSEIKRVFPNGWEKTDIPSYIRTRDEKEQEVAEAEDREAEEIMEENTTLEEKEEKLTN